MLIHLTKADNADIEELIGLEKSVAGTNIYVPMLTEDEWMVALEIGVVYLIMQGSVAVGNISYENKGKDRVHISGLVIGPQFQGQGIGRQALIKVLEELQDVKRIDLEIHPDNEKALALYQSFGFKVESRKENFYGDGQPRLILTLEK